MDIATLAPRDNESGIAVSAASSLIIVLLGVIVFVSCTLFLYVELWGKVQSVEDQLEEVLKLLKEPKGLSVVFPVNKCPPTRADWYLVWNKERDWDIVLWTGIGWEGKGRSDWTHWTDLPPNPL